MRKAPSPKTVKILYAASGGICAFPGCNTRLVDSTSGALLGEMCHIAAASKGGPRFNPALSDSDLSEKDNLIILCPTHHSLIDQDPHNYSADKLRQMKAEHECRIAEIVGGSQEIIGIKLATDFARQVDGESIDFAIIVALQEELNALKYYFPELQLVQSIKSQTRRYYAATVPTLNGGSYRIVATLLNSMGNLEAAHATSTLINSWNPRYILVNGIAGGLNRNSQEFGDIVISESITYYEIGKIVGEKTTPRNKQFPSDQTLLNSLLNFTNSSWRLTLPSRPDGKKTNNILPKVHIGPFASGEKIIASLNTVNSLKKYQSNLIAIEMESAGVASAAFSALKKIGFISIRAICDFADSSKNDKWHEYAAKAATSYLRAFLASRPVAFSEGRWPSLEVSTQITKSTDSLKIRYHLFESICKAVDMEEFKNFCFLIGVDFDELSGDRKSAYVRELILLFERRNKIDSLLDAVSEILLTDANKITAETITGTPSALGNSATVPLVSRPSEAPSLAATLKVDITRVLRYTPAELIGREDEIKLLNGAWAKVQNSVKSRPRILTFVALGGEGKTSLVAKWAAGLAAKDWPGCDAAFAWSFYSQGTRNIQAASSELFLNEAITFFGNDADKAFAASRASAIEKSQRLVSLVGERRSLLLLDGLEPLQYAPTAPTPGELKDQGIAVLLKGLAAASHGLCIVTTRYSLPDLKAFWETTAAEVNLMRLSRDAGMHLLKTLGVTGTEQEFAALVEDVKGHALTLALLGGFLKRAFNGDIRQRDRVKFEKADNKMDGGHAFRTLSVYEQWLLRDGGEEGRREVAILRFMGLFDRPADAGCLNALLKLPVIPDLTEPLVGLAEDDLEFCLTGLESAKLLTINREASAISHSALGNLESLDAHPHLREYFSKQLREQKPDAWRAAHRRIYKHLCATAKEGDQPKLEELQPLFQAVRHACYADEYLVAWSQIYRHRIQKGDDHHAFHRLGAFGSILDALVCFFESPWKRPVSYLGESERGELLNNTGYALWGLARGEEALACLDASLETHLALSDWKESAIDAENLAQLCLTLGKVGLSVKYAESGVEFADRSRLPLYQKDNRAVLGHCLHMAGEFQRAVDVFAKAATFDKFVDEVSHNYLSFLYLELLLDKGQFKKVNEIASAFLASASPSEPVLRIATHRLALACAMFETSHGEASNIGKIQELLNKSVDELRQSKRYQDLPRGLLARAKLNVANGKFGDAKADLDEAWEIAESGRMQLFMADIHLSRARLFFREVTYPWESPTADLASARKLIVQCGYWRRKEELEVTEGRLSQQCS
jgi:nucleoside phosphorylase/tetratricopeptide (TPR) repeat protein